MASLSNNFISFNPRFPYSDIFLVTSGLPRWLWSFANFDGVHYLTIVKSGYSAQFTGVFFPLFPLIIRSITYYMNFVNPILIGLIATNLFFLLAIYIFWKLLYLDYKQKIIIWILIFFILFPTSFFYGSLYTESLFITLVFSSFLFARKKKWWISGILGGLASATRVAGIFLLPALLWEWHKEKFKVQSSKFKVTAQSSKLSNFYIRVLHFALCILHSPILYLVPLGLISYMLYLQFAFGDWLYFWHVQPVFGAERSGQGIVLLPQVIFRYLKILITVSYLNEAYWISLSELIFSGLAIFLLLVASRKKVRSSYLIFSWLGVLIPTLTGTFSSMPRYILIAFPIYIILGMIKGKIIKIFLLIISFILLVIYTSLFTQGHWVA